MIIRFSARKLATVKPESDYNGNSVLIGAEMTTRDLTDAMTAIASALPMNIWQRTVEKINNEENLI
jgi:hypothetical protein